MRKQFIFLLVGVLALAGCAKEAGNGGRGDEISMRVVPSIAGETKAGMLADDLSEFYLQVKSSNPKYSYFGKNSKSGSDWSSGERWCWENNAASVSCSAAFFSGHAFTDQEFADGAELTVPADQSTESALKSADLLTMSSKTVKYQDTNDGAMTVELSHGLSKVNFVLSLGEVYYNLKVSRSDNPVKQFRVKNVNTGFTFKPGSVTVKSGTQKDITPFEGDYTPSTSSNKTATAIFEAIMAPQTFAAGELEVSFRIVESDGIWTDFTWTNTSVITLESGKTHNLPVSATRPDVYNGHEYVDLGISVKWASCNVGAGEPWEYGDYFAWGETEPYYSSLEPLTWKSGKSGGYSWSSYFDTSDNGTTFTKYTTGKSTILSAADDAATANWGASWRIPTLEDYYELSHNCTVVWTTQNGVNGRLFKSKLNGNSIFLPAAGFLGSTKFYDVGSEGYYWFSSIINTSPGSGWNLSIRSSAMSIPGVIRKNGLSVRPVTK